MTEELLTIGDFARASGLSHKALRLYDDLGLLVPAYVDPASGYRFYGPGQLDRAVLVGSLRRLGMPLARIADVVGLGPAGASAAVAGWWAGVEEQTGARRDLAAFLVHDLARKGTAMTAPMTAPRYTVRHATGLDTGLVRPAQQDAVHADDPVFAVADGFGDTGADASAAALAALVAALPDAAEASTDVVQGLRDAVAAADGAVGAAVGDTGRTAAAGTTLTALVRTAGGFAVVHVGDSRVYLLRDGGLFRLTRDDSLVQAMVDEGRLTPEEAWAHPQRPMLAKALVGRGVEADVRLRDARDGDRYLVCSDGLSAVLPEAVVRTTLTAAADPQAAVDDLLAAVRDAGAPDNVGVVVADVLAVGGGTAVSGGTASGGRATGGTGLRRLS
ncbi:MerR family transcriptional regulator [Kineosporia sp. A_224]|uniref:MerR family transcriptional regulator n=1 Tax=Kineosporia sp. A_224 TaxID=1962180 RepID=UPI000B4AE25E|nr:MerR family transcriptional regulator [Kineosporia sp. A_224]